MALKKSQGSIGESMVIAEAIKRGYKAALPFGEDWRYDLIVLKMGNWKEFNVNTQNRTVRRSSLDVAV